MVMLLLVGRIELLLADLWDSFGAKFIPVIEWN
jgi:hypothetical protein